MCGWRETMREFAVLLLESSSRLYRLHEMLRCDLCRIVADLETLTRGVHRTSGQLSICLLVIVNKIVKILIKNKVRPVVST